MELLWFYVAIALAISDELHGRIVGSIARDFYIVFGGLLSTTFHSVMETWIAHEFIEAVFHFILISIVFLSFKIGFLAALIHFFRIFHILKYSDFKTNIAFSYAE